MRTRRDRGGARTRASIAAVATELFLEHGFDAVTIAEVAAAAGVSKVTVFAHFEHKEDLLLDHLPDAVEVVRRAVAERDEETTVLQSLLRSALDLADRRDILSGLAGDIQPFMRTIADSPSLVARLRAFQFEIEAELAALLRADPRFAGDADLAAALLVAAYRAVATRTVHRRLDGDDLDEVAAAHRRDLQEAFRALAEGLTA